MANLEKVVKVTQEQYDVLASGGTVGEYTGLDDNYVYLIEDENEYLPTSGGTITGDLIVEGNTSFKNNSTYTSNKGIEFLYNNGSYTNTGLGINIDGYGDEIIYLGRDENGDTLYKPLLCDDSYSFIYSENSDYLEDISFQTSYILIEDLSNTGNYIALSTSGEINYYNATSGYEYSYYLPIPQLHSFGTLALKEETVARTFLGANEFSDMSTYAIGDRVTHEGKLYRCISAITTAGSWDSSKWSEITINDYSTDKWTHLSYTINDQPTGDEDLYFEGVLQVTQSDYDKYLNDEDLDLKLNLSAIDIELTFIRNFKTTTYDLPPYALYYENFEGAVISGYAVITTGTEVQSQYPYVLYYKLSIISSGGIENLHYISINNGLTQDIRTKVGQKPSLLLAYNSLFYSPLDLVGHNTYGNLPDNYFAIDPSTKIFYFLTIDWGNLTFTQTNTTFEQTSNKVSSWSATTTDTHYPSEKLVKDSLDLKQDILTAGTGIAITNNVISSTLDGVDYEVVQTLPLTGKKGTIYLVPNGESGTQNIYDEYIWIPPQESGDSGRFEFIGTTETDLSNYVTLDTNQIISGAKTFNKLLKSRNVNDYQWRFGAESYNFVFERYNGSTLTNRFGLSNTAFFTQNAGDLGTADLKWRDLYLSGEINLKGGTREAVITSDSTAGLIIRDGATGGGIKTGYISGVGASIVPYASNTSLGKSDSTWLDLYLSGQINLGTTDTAIKTDQYGNLRFRRNGEDKVALAAALQPASDGSLDLGVSTIRWGNLYIKDNLSDGTNSITVANIQEKVQVKRFI